jgi:hypothetical protein
MEATKDEAYENARYLSLPERCENTAQFIFDTLMSAEWDSSYSPLSEKLYSYLVVCIDEVYDARNRRDCGVIYVGDKQFYLTGGISYGDQPTEAYNSFSVCELLGLTLKQPTYIPIHITDDDFSQVYDD